jgi:hypothetical protein
MATTEAPRSPSKKFYPNAGLIVTDDPPTTKGRKKTAELPQTLKMEAREFKQKFRLKHVKDIKPILATLAAWHMAIVRFSVAFATLPKKSSIVFEKVTEAKTRREFEVRYTMKHVKEADRLYLKALRNIEYYLRVKGTKKIVPGAVSAPTVFSKPVYIPPGPLLDWIHTESFGSYNGMPIRDYVKSQTGLNFVYFDQGLANRQSIDNLFNLAISVGGAGPVGGQPGSGLTVPDQLQADGTYKKMGSVFFSPAMRAAFSKRSDFVSARGPRNTFVNIPQPPESKLSLLQAVQQSVSEKNAIKRANPEVDPKRVHDFNAENNYFANGNTKSLYSLGLPPQKALADGKFWEGFTTARKWSFLPEGEYPPYQLTTDENTIQFLKAEEGALRTVQSSRSTLKTETAIAARKKGKITLELPAGL